jgi:hypothetical protein
MINPRRSGTIAARHDKMGYGRLWSGQARLISSPKILNRRKE